MGRITLKDFLTGRELQIFEEGYDAGFNAASGGAAARRTLSRPRQLPATKRKLSAWNKFVKANSKKPRFIYRNGKLNLKKNGCGV